jgi:hypothetical protein
MRREKREGSKGEKEKGVGARERKEQKGREVRE